VHLDLALTHADVEDVARPFVVRTLEHLDAAMRDAGVHARDAPGLARGRLQQDAARPSDDLRAPRAPRPRRSRRRPYRGARRVAACGAHRRRRHRRGTGQHRSHTLSVGVLDEECIDGESDDLAAHPAIPRDTVVPVERTQTVYTVTPTRRPPSCPSCRASERAHVRQHRTRRRARRAAAASIPGERGDCGSSAINPELSERASTPTGTQQGIAQHRRGCLASRRASRTKRPRRHRQLCRRVEARALADYVIEPSDARTSGQLQGRTPPS
jgi:hypothetical protein